jgi:hypothetical protein
MKNNIEDILNGESEVLNRIADEVINLAPDRSDGARHSSSTTGHRSGSSHSSHSSAMKEKLKLKTKARENKSKK